MREPEVIERLRRIATDPGARGLLDDVAVLENFVVTHDTIAEGVHFLPSDPPASVGWKLVAVNLSDLAAKGATPAGALLSLTISGESGWEDAFLGGVEAACESYGLPLLGGDTIALPSGAPRVLGLTAIGRAGTHVPDRAGAEAGDTLWLVGTIGDAATGLALLRANPKADGPLVDVYRRPIPQLGAGETLAPHAHAMMDVSDGLLLDASRMAVASGLGVTVDLAAIPLSVDYSSHAGADRAARLAAATSGDDYALLFAMPAGAQPPVPAALIGSFANGAGLTLRDGAETIPIPRHLGFEHRV